MTDWTIGCGLCGRVIGCICYHCRFRKVCDCTMRPELTCPDLGEQRCDNYEPINKKENENHV